MNTDNTLFAGRTLVDWRDNLSHTGCSNDEARALIDTIVALRAERAARPEDVEAVAHNLHDWMENAESVKGVAGFGSLTWEDLGKGQDILRDVAQAIITRYGLPPSPPQITDADVERCAEAYRTTYSVSYIDFDARHRAGIRAALTAFLNPPPPDPIDTAMAHVRRAAGAHGYMWSPDFQAAVREGLEMARRGRDDA